MKRGRAIPAAVVAAAVWIAGFGAAQAEALAVNTDRVIPFTAALPRMRNGSDVCGTYNNVEFSVPGCVTTRDPVLGRFLAGLRNVVWADRRVLRIDGRTIFCNPNWIRDHVHVMKGTVQWERDLTGWLDYILDTQRADGMFYELVKQMDDPHWRFVNEDCRRLFPEDNLALVRLELEADVEYLVVEGCLRAWRATGDDAWLKRALPRLEKAIDYVTRDAKRWTPELGLVKRAYTIDTWDFTFKEGGNTNRRIEPGTTPMGVMHGDNTGVFQAMRQLAWINARFGDRAKADAWNARAETLRGNIMRHLWNGKFFVHIRPVDGTEPFDAKEGERLSMSDAYALNRGILTLEERRGVIDAYRARRASSGAFAEWFTIDPPYAVFNGYPSGEYVNGAICPFTAAELALGAFESGYEEYAWDIITRLEKLHAKEGGIQFLYHPRTGAGQGRGPSAWGAADILHAVERGLAGLEDLDSRYGVLGFSPRWTVTPYTELRYLTGYEASGTFVDVRHVRNEKGLRYRVQGPSREIRAHILLPAGKTCAEARVNGVQVPFTAVTVARSPYVDLAAAPAGGVADIEIVYRDN